MKVREVRHKRFSLSAGHAQFDRKCNVFGAFKGSLAPRPLIKSNEDFGYESGAPAKYTYFVLFSGILLPIVLQV